MALLSLDAEEGRDAGTGLSGPGWFTAADVRSSRYADGSEKPRLKGTDTLSDELKSPALRKPHPGSVPPVSAIKVPVPDPK